MPESSLPPELCEILERDHSEGLAAMLLSPHLAEGMVIFDPLDEQMSVRGDFIPGSITVNVSVIERCRLLLAEAGLVLNVLMFPGQSESGSIKRFHFQLIDSKSMEKGDKLHPRCPPMKDGM